MLFYRSGLNGHIRATYNYHAIYTNKNIKKMHQFKFAFFLVDLITVYSFGQNLRVEWVVRINVQIC